MKSLPEILDTSDGGRLKIGKRMKRKTTKAEKPDARKTSGLVAIDKLGWWINFKDHSLYPKQARKLAKWLLQAADYIEATKPGSKR